MSDVRKLVQEAKEVEVNNSISLIIKYLNQEGYIIDFGKIGTRTTYAIAYTPDHSEEIVGYTYISDLKYYKENIGKLKALQQVLARKKLLENKTDND